ncbi:MAG: AraC family transcriptional regulator [Atopobiaceae bacterium]|jgi:AraC-like DNA-binding protein|nr:AraC family transcriptional regulator [Atopobiaceae bacterium]
MLAYVMDVEERSTWLRTTPGASELAQPFFCTEAGEFYAREGFATTRSRKDSYLVFYSLGGTGLIVQEGRKVELEAGHALLMDCRAPQLYQTAPGHRRWHHLWTHVDGDGVRAMVEHGGLPLLAPIRLAEPTARHPFSTLAESLERPDIGSRALAGLAVHELLAAMVAASVADETGTTTADLVKRICALVDERYADGLSLADMAAAASVSPSYLLRLFKRHVGTTPYNYLLQRRITKSKELLSETVMSVSEISRAVGFTSESNFSYRFSAMVGQSPREYRLASPLTIEGRG